jgi:hypothetical protein
VETGRLLDLRYLDLEGEHPEREERDPQALTVLG